MIVLLEVIAIQKVIRIGIILRLIIKKILDKFNLISATL